MFTQEDELLLAKRGITEAHVMDQLECFKKGFPYLSLDGPASVDNGIVKAEGPALDDAIAQWNEYLQSSHRIVKFVPASGAASRMFKNLFEFLTGGHDEPVTDFEHVKYLLVLGASFVVATPLAWYLIHQYTADFVVKAPVGIGIFVFALLLVAVISMGTLWWQIRKAANIDPATVMKNE